MTEAVRLSSLAGTDVNVAFFRSGGLAPSLSSSIAQLVKYWVQDKKAGKITGLSLRMYMSAYKGLLTGDSFILPESDWGAVSISMSLLVGRPLGACVSRYVGMSD
jgi:6-phosphofructokinase